jgi:hypothetical protein
LSERQTDKKADAARAAYYRRVGARARRNRTLTQSMRQQRERLALGYSLRRELTTLAQGAADLLRAAQGQGRAAQRAAVRLAARRHRAEEVLLQADRFGLDPALAELEPQDRQALGLPEV